MGLIRPFIRIFQWFTTIIIWGVVAGIFVAGWFYFDLPNIDDALEATRSPTITIISDDGEILASRGDRYGVTRKITDVPESLINAILATEDRRFYRHHGIDFIGLSRAIWTNLMARRIVQGGSTITQQVAKNLFLSPARSFKRKAQELMLAFWLEYKFSKNQILTIYLNRVYLGAGTYGFDAASKVYFGKPVKKISTYQAAMLAGLLKAPSKYNPRANRKLAHDRAVQVLKNMVAAGYLTNTKINVIKKNGALQRIRASNQTGGYFTDWILNEIKSYVSIGNQDLKVFTTLNAGLQRKAQNIISNSLSLYGQSKRVKNGALLMMEPSGAILAMVGGKSYKGSQFNRVTQARRQPGSVFKPIVYLSGLESGFTPKSIFTDAPIKIDGWNPKNFDMKYRGDVTLKTALSQSINTVAIQVAQKVGLRHINETAKRLGINSQMSRDLSIALGTSELTLMEITSAYASFSNGGFATMPFGILAITSGAGQVLYKRTGSGPGRVISIKQVHDMNYMLSAVLFEGTGRLAKLDIPAAGKTGTSQNFRDAWFLGYTEQLITGVWVGNDNGSPMKSVTGGGLPARIWREAMIYAIRNPLIHINKRDKTRIISLDNISKPLSPKKGVFGKIFEHIKLYID